MKIKASCLPFEVDHCIRLWNRLRWVLTQHKTILAWPPSSLLLTSRAHIRSMLGFSLHPPLQKCLFSTHTEKSQTRVPELRTKHVQRSWKPSRYLIGARNTYFKFVWNKCKIPKCFRMVPFGFVSRPSLLPKTKAYQALSFHPLLTRNDVTTVLLAKYGRFDLRICVYQVTPRQYATVW